MCSPWYIYPHLPGYLINIRVDFNIPRYEIRCDTDYDWRYNNRYDSYQDSYKLDNSVKDIVDLFERRDERSLDRLTPSRADVVIRNENQRAYKISADDFYDLLYDAAFGTRTERYRVLRVQTGRNQAIVTAEHLYRDSWGQNERAYHRYVLRETYDGYEVIEFGTSDRRW